MNDKEISDAVKVAIGVIPIHVANVEQVGAIGKLLTQFLTDFSDLASSLGCMASIAIDHHEGCMVPEDEELEDVKPEGTC